MTSKKQFKNQAELFRHIWEVRPHFSELSGKPLLRPGHYQWHWQFLHVLPKGIYPKYKLNPDNIILATPEEHDLQETFQKFREKKEELTQEYYKEFYGKEF